MEDDSDFLATINNLNDASDLDLPDADDNVTSPTHRLVYDSFFFPKVPSFAHTLLGVAVANSVCQLIRVRVAKLECRLGPVHKEVAAFMLDVASFDSAGQVDSVAAEGIRVKSTR
ncbi:hypothetical protein ACFX16_017469 [Malus domestica]